MNPNASQSFSKQLFSTALLVVGWLLLGLGTLVIVGTLFSRIPYLGMAGLVGSGFPLVFGLLPLLGGALVWWQARQAIIRRVAVTLALLAAGTLAGITASMFRAVEAAGADLSLSSVFALGEKVAQPDTVVQFGSFANKPLLTSVFRPAKGFNLGQAPVFVYIHGGGWVSNTREELSQEQRWFAQQGWLVFSVDYPLSSPTQHYWDTVHSQLGCALAWIAQHAGEYGGSTDRLTLSGGSAGGNLALNVASLANAGRLTSACGGAIPHVGAVSVQVPGVNLVSIFHNDYSVIGPAVHEMVVQYTGGTPQQYPERYRAVASATYLSAHTPPTLILAAKSDHLVPLASIVEYARQSMQAGVPTKLVQVPFADHVNGGYSGGIVSTGFRQLTAQWLAKYGLAPRRR